MATQTTSMTTSEFARAAGIPVASISKLIREGKLKAKKKGGKWMLPQGQLDAAAVRALKKPAPGAKRNAPANKAVRPSTAPKAKTAPPPVASAGAPPPSPEPEPVRAVVPPEPAPAAPPQPKVRSAEKTFTISEFAAMTYLTEKGVGEWLKSGRLKGVQTESGEWQVLESNIQSADISRLLRR
jgi:hypothetical protein